MPKTTPTTQTAAGGLPVKGARQRKFDRKMAKIVGDKPVYEPFKMRQLMLDLDEYLRVFILPQIPVAHKDFRTEVRESVDRAWRALYLAGFTVRRERQKRLLEMKVELAMIETYLREVRDVCFRGREKRRLDAASARRFEVCAKKQMEVKRMLWGWIENENKALDASKTEKTAGLTEGVE